MALLSLYLAQPGLTLLLQQSWVLRYPAYITAQQHIPVLIPRLQLLVLHLGIALLQ